MREAALRGAHSAAAAVADGLALELRATPAIALERARARMREGRMTLAAAALAAADLDAAAVGERLLIAIEAASILIYRDGAIAAALAAAAAAWTGSADANAGDLAEARLVETRIVLSAATYYEVDAVTGSRALDGLPVIVRELEQAGRVDAALRARMTFAEQAGPAVRADALTEFAGRALSAGRLGLAGEALVTRAELLMEAAAATDAVEAELSQAERIFEKARHAYGAVAVRRVRAQLGVERAGAGLEPLAACADGYRAADYPRGELSLLIDLAQYAHQRGDTAAAATYRGRAVTLADEIGMGLARDNFVLMHADLHMRNNAFGAAIELSQAALASNPPAFVAASHEQLLASAYALLGDDDASIAHARAALTAFESIAAVGPASNAAWGLAGDFVGSDREELWAAAEKMLRDWIGKDELLGDIAGVSSKRELLAQIAFKRFFWSLERRGQPALLAEGERELDAAEELACKLSGRDAAQRVGNIRQLRGQLYQARGDLDAVEQTFRDAIVSYASGAMEMEVANCRYLIGALRLNRANLQLLPHFGVAQDHLRGALDYYAGAGMRGQAADTRFMFARLYANAQPRVPSDVRDELLDAALGHLSAAEADYDEVRREYAAGSVLEVQKGKLAVIARGARIYDLALELVSVRRPDPEQAWHWVQRSKARGLGDAMGSGSLAPSRTLAALRARPSALAFVLKEQELTARIAGSKKSRPALRGELAEVHRQMAADPDLADYLELRTGAAFDRGDRDALLAAAGGCVAVDWVITGDALLLLVVREGEAPRLVPLLPRVSEVRAFVTQHLAPRSFRSTLRDMPELLRELDGLIAPLDELTRPEELLVLAPAGPLHALPLHALDIDGAPLLARNPVVYCPSLGILRHCLSRSTGRPPRTAALFGDPSGDQAEAAEIVGDLARRFEARPFIRDQVTRDTFTRAVAGSDLVHFQGHAVHDRDNPLASHLVLADGPLSAREVFGLAELRAQLVTLAACESAANVVATGDEPLGLIPAFLYAGAGAVLATLWRVHRVSAACTMGHFYDALAGQAGNKAQALREAALYVRGQAGLESPYHWAAYVLYGTWE